MAKSHNNRRQIDTCKWNRKATIPQETLSIKSNTVAHLLCMKPLYTLCNKWTSKR